MTNDPHLETLTEITRDPEAMVKKRRHSIQLLSTALLATLISCLHYLITMTQWTNPGFPLDDSWIHLQFARAIAEGTPWEYSPGYPSTGCTSPLWAIVLSPLFLLTNDARYVIWGTYAISATLYIASSYLVGAIVTDYTSSPLWGHVCIIGFVMMPRNTWLMMSGMETPLFFFFLMLSVVFLDRDQPKYDLLLGIAVGLAYLSRPEGILIGAVCVPARMIILAWSGRMSPKRLLSFIAAGAIALIIALPWILHCVATTGRPLPDTFYAKVHAPEGYEIEAWDFWWSLWLVTYPFILIGLILGLVLIRKGRPHLWLLALSMTILYRVSLAYTSLMNNARWLVPVFDLFLITSIPAVALTVELLFNKMKIDQEIFRKSFTLMIIIAFVFVPLIPDYNRQTSYFGNAVKNINDQQVEVALWIKENTPEDAIIAVTDSGALRFFSDRAIIDLAGLVSPEFTYANLTTIECIQYLRNRSCEYFAFFDEFFYPTYYHILRLAVEKVFSVTLTDNVITVRDTLSVFYINWSRWQFIA
ncbi:MAG: hypothetical protein JSW61_10610 [Candidatus Thorarchaeota archaeon]|nr:MAG: hypothetical protein JSW61_10610 [Candidatus Thorarchaeota archaeon]